MTRSKQVKYSHGTTLNHLGQASRFVYEQIYLWFWVFETETTKKKKQKLPKETAKKS